MSVRTLLRMGAVTLAVSITAGASLAYAQDTLVVETKFAFRTGAALHQPGRYELRPSADESVFQITPSKGPATVAAVVTRLEKSETPSPDGKVVFDKVGPLYYLSEVWIPGFDGYLVRATKEKHTHVAVRTTKKG